MKNTFGVNLRNIRDQRDMSQEQLAAMLGTSKQVISRYETGLRTPKITTVQEYAEKLGISPVDLAGYDLQEIEKPATITDDELNELAAMFLELSPDNRSKLLELCRLYLASQRNSE